MRRLLCNRGFSSKKKNQRLKLLFIFVSFLLFPAGIQAACSYERSAELSRIAANVQFSYNYEMLSGYPEFTVNITNVSSDIYVVDSQGNIFSGKNEFNPKYSHGKKVTYDIYANDNNCKNEKVLTTYVNIPFFNQYSMLPECKNYSEFQLCSLWYDTSSYTETEFYDELAKYKDLSKQEIVNNEKSWFEKLKEVFMEKTNFIYFILTVIGIFILIGIWVVKKVRR